MLFQIHNRSDRVEVRYGVQVSFEFKKRIIHASSLVAVAGEEFVWTRYEGGGNFSCTQIITSNKIIWTEFRM